MVGSGGIANRPGGWRMLFASCGVTLVMFPLRQPAFRVTPLIVWLAATCRGDGG